MSSSYEGSDQIAGASDRPYLRWGVIFAIWTGLGILSACQGALSLSHAGLPVPWRVLVIDRLADWYTCALFYPAYVWLARRYPVDRQHWKVAIPLLLVATSVFVVLKYALYNEVRVLIVPGSTPRTLGATLARNFIVETIAFWAVIAAVHATEFYRRVRERELQEERLRTQLVEARLDALASQLHPHFLFNTLHGISSLMHQDVEAADTMLAQLSELLRRTLESSERREVTLREELDLLERYLAIVRVRFRDRLTVRVRMEKGADMAMVPHFLLQPLVENALEHGIGSRAGSGTIEVRAAIRGTRLEVSVTDDGSGLRRSDTGEHPPTEGVGLSNSRRRLATLYGAEQSLTLNSVAGQGLSVVVSLPFRNATAAEHTASATLTRPTRNSAPVVMPVASA